jgi:lipoyl-dependent peroxiredoxin
MKFTRTASAVWNGDLKQGKGTISTESAVLQSTPYAFNNRFDNVKGTNPEELIGAAHAGCYSMALSASLGKAGFTPTKIATTAKVTFEMVNNAPTISTIDLEMRASVPGIDKAKFDEIANDAKANCPVSRVLNAKINLSATLE